MATDDGILVIDSDETIRALLSEFFGAQGNRVYPAENTAEALRIIDTVQTPVALIDIGLGSSCSPDQIDRLQRADPELKIILLSGSPTVESVIDALRMRVFDFVVKPFYLKDLKEIVDRALTGTRERTTTGIMRRRIDMLETMLQRHGLTPPDGGAPETGLVSEKERSVVAAESGQGRRGKAGGRP